MNKEKESIGILGLLIFLGVLTGGMIAGYFLGHGHYKNKKEPKKEENSHFKEDEKEKAYQEFVQNYLQFRTNLNLNTQKIIIDNEPEAWITGTFLNAKGDLVVTIASTSPLYQEYGPQYKVLEKALKVDLLEMGNGGFKCLVVIMEDGTIAVIEQTEVLNTKKLEAKKYNEYKRIVDVKNISVTDGITGAYSIVLIDINGKTYFFE